ncbi:MAG: YkgJ family cysteine cluster protein [Desulfofustis sp.]|nr:YkgJ family cysteine cluster protein [Desulfofustis sp.]MBT8347165.1 YkgJ family cysteine cluster protein [Desulfofustis sp.]NNF47968.1 YkgJ family cysteine cluster protein [Desulfofustis sp.]NNK57762.1 YkgJ family cysteine cluster protein [Desulfofustis sp.]
MPDLDKIFQCTQCGFCCHGETTVSLDEEDQRRMIAAVEKPADEVAAQFWRITGSIVQMKTVQGHCIFYDDGCTVYHGRPWRCKQWPLVPALLEDENNFLIIRDSCPGINRKLSYEEFREIMARLLGEGAENNRLS